PTAPGVIHPSATRTIFRLYSIVNRCRVAFATTSIAGPPRTCSHAFIALRSCLALDSKLPGGRCLTHVGREGRCASAHGELPCALDNTRRPLAAREAQLMEYIAFDAHKHYTLASVALPDGQLVREQRIAHERGALQQFLERCERGSPVAVETVGNWYWIVDEIE